MVNDKREREVAQVTKDNMYRISPIENWEDCRIPRWFTRTCLLWWHVVVHSKCQVDQVDTNDYNLDG